MNSVREILACYHVVSDLLPDMIISKVACS